MDPVSCVSCVSGVYSVNAAEKHETFHWESGMRYQSRHSRSEQLTSDYPGRCAVAVSVSGGAYRVELSALFGF